MLWAWSAMLALLCTLISYPGIWYSDSYVRVTTGEAVLNAVVKMLQGHRALLETHNAFSLIPSFFIAASLGATGHVAFYTFAQAFAFFAAIFLLIRELCPPGWKLQCVFFAVCPLIYGASVYYEANIGSAVGMIVLILLFRRISEKKTQGERIIEFCLIAFASLVTFGYRTNALTILPVLLIYLWKTQKKKMQRFLPVLAVACGLLLAWLIPVIVGVHSESNGSVGFIWEIVTAIQRMEPEDQAACQDYLDDISREGTTREFIESSTEVSANSFMWSEAMNSAELSAPGTMGRVAGKYLRLLWEHPREWFSVKKDFVLRALGLREKLDFSEYDYNRWESMDQYGFNDSLQRRLFHRSYVRTNELLGFYTCRPWVPFLISLIMILIERFRKNKKRGLYTLLFWMAAFYYGAYLIVIVGFELRFFYPALLLLMMLDCAVMLEWILALFQAIRRKNPHGKDSQL